jgi:hypothetical protein
MSKPVGTPNKKAKKWTDPKRGKDKNHALASFRKWKKIEKARKTAELDRYNELCGPVSVTYINK